MTAHHREFSSLLRRVAAYTLGLVLVAAILAWLSWSSAAALGVALGALLGLGNIMVLGHTVMVLVGSVRIDAPRQQQNGVLALLLLLRLTFVAVALGAVLWYLPVEPATVAIGICIPLIGLAILGR